MKDRFEKCTQEEDWDYSFGESFGEIFALRRKVSPQEDGGVQSTEFPKRETKMVRALVL
jgi:hypothetical protein